MSLRRRQAARTFRNIAFALLAVALFVAMQAALGDHLPPGVLP